MKQLMHKTFHALGFNVSRYPGFSTLERRLARLMATKNVDLVLDVGANVGQFAGLLRRNGYKGRIASFEPIKATFVTLAATAEADKLWTIYQVALGSEEGQRTMNVMQGTDLSSFYHPSDYGKACFATEVVTHQEIVQVARLDRFLSEEMKAEIGTAQRKSIFLKIDTQGHDLDVFKGAEGVLASVVVLLMELSVRPIYQGTPNWLEVIQEVQSKGFLLFDLFPIQNDKEGAVIEYDGLFVRNGN